VRILLLTIFLFQSVYSVGQLPGLTGKLQDPSSGAYFSEISDPFAIVLNPAAGALIKKKVFAFSGEKRFGLKSFNLLSTILAFPVSSGSWSSQLDYFGFGSYAETQLSLAYAQNLGTRAGVGLRFHLIHLRVPNFQSQLAVYPQVGFRYIVHRDLVIGWSLSNPTGVIRLQGNRSFQPLVVRIGFGYRLSDVAAVAAEILKEEGRMPGVVIGVRYMPIQGFSIRLGINTMARQPFLNMTLQKSNWQYVTGLALHQELGISPTITGICFF
jgi:hypothetical protein